MRGRKPKSTEEKELSGNAGKRKLNKNRAQAPAGEMVCPQHFTKEQRTIWNETLATAPRGVIKPADTELLTAFCIQISLQRQAQRELNVTAEDNRKPDGSSSFLTVETERGWVKNPIVTVLDTCAKNIRSLASELGLSPASRERLASKLPDAADEDWEIFGTPAGEAKVQ